MLCMSLCVVYKLCNVLGSRGTGDMWPAQEEQGEPDWVRTEREQFASFRDKDGDGRMDQNEVRDWVMPDDYDHTEAEAKHLVFESDMDRVRTACVRVCGFV